MVNQQTNCSTILKVNVIYNCTFASFILYKYFRPSFTATATSLRPIQNMQTLIIKQGQIIVIIYRLCLGCLFFFYKECDYWTYWCPKPTPIASIRLTTHKCHINTTMSPVTRLHHLPAFLKYFCIRFFLLTFDCGKFRKITGNEGREKRENIQINILTVTVNPIQSKIKLKPNSWSELKPSAIL